MTNSSPRLRASPPLLEVSRAVRKSPRSLGNCPTRLFRHFPETLRRLPRLLPRLFGDFSGFWGRRPRRHFRDFFGISGSPAPEELTSMGHLSFFGFRTRPLTQVSQALRARNAEKISKMSYGAGEPEMPKKSRKCLPGLRPQKPEKSPKSLRSSLGSLRRVSGKCRKSLVGLFPRLFGDFQTARETSVRGRLVRNLGLELVSLLNLSRWPPEICVNCMFCCLFLGKITTCSQAQV